MLRLSLSFVVLSATAAAPSSPAVPVASRARYLMGTVCEGIAYGEHAAVALDASLDEIARLESILSDYRIDSELSRLNRSAASRPFACSTDLFDLIATSVRLAEGTGGAFDITVAPLISVWDLRGRGRVPPGPELQQARRRVGSSLLSLDASRCTVRFGLEGMALDPGAIGKGYALDAAGRVLRARGVSAALLDFGGQVLALGAPPGAETWSIDIADPLHRDLPVMTIGLRDASISTSGNSERHVRVGDLDLGHIVDPRTGRPSQAVGSASVIAPTATQADALSTAMLVLGPVEGRPRIERMPGCSALWLDPDASGRLRASRSTGFVANNPVRRRQAGTNNEGGER